MSRRVVITGLGPITAFGPGIEPLWSAMLEGRSAIRGIERFDPCGFPCKIAAELGADRFEPRKVVPKSYRKATKVMCRDIELAVGAAAAAVEDAGLVTKAVDPEAEPTIPPHRMGCHIGAGLIAADTNELGEALVTSRAENGDFSLHDWGRNGMDNLTPLWLLKYLPNMLACHVTIVHDCQGPSNTITCCEASGALSLGESLRVIDRGAADACLTGGVEFKINLLAMMRQHFAGRLATTEEGEDPTTVVRPFDPAARGSVLGEGGGILVVEALSCAATRGARVYAEVAGFACTQSYCPDTIGLKIEADGQGICDATEIALEQARIGPDEIDAIAPLGSSTPHVDQAEAAAIRQVFGDRSAEIPLITTVPNVGNCCAGNGAIPLAVASMCLKTQTLPARLNTTEAPGLDAGACPSRDAELRYVLVSTTSQGGQNAAVILKRFDDEGPA